jgi:hypothetical protein
MVLLEASKCFAGSQIPSKFLRRGNSSLAKAKANTIA